MSPEPPENLVLFDGLCGFCDASIQWLLRHDSQKRLRFSPLQGETAAAILSRHPSLPPDLDSLILIQRTSAGETLAIHSMAAFGIAKLLPMPYRVLSFFSILPRPLTDWGYKTFARYRYYVWGRKDACRIPTPAERALFLP